MSGISEFDPVSEKSSENVDNMGKVDYAIYNIKKENVLFSVNFYREEDGTKPVGQFIRSLDVKMRAKVVSDLHRLEMHGNEARAPLSKHLEDDIFEMRSVMGNDIVRILYFSDGEQIIIATNGFVKKQQKTPRSEIMLAKKREAVYLWRKERSVQ